MKAPFEEMVRADSAAQGLPGMGTVIETIGQITVVRAPPGTLGPRNSEDLGRELAALSGPGVRVVIDLGRVDDIDETGCGVILTGHRRLAGEGGRLNVCGLSPSVRLRFQVARIHQRMEVFNTEREAIESLRR